MENRLSPQRLKRRNAFTSLRRLALAALVIVAVPGCILIGCKSRGSYVNQGTRALIDAFSKQRLIEPRLSGGFKRGEFKSSLDDASDIDKAKLDGAGDLIRDALDKREPQAQLAYAWLLLSEGKKLPEAAKYLRRELASSPDSAEAHNDLGVCLILQDKLEDALDEFEAALKYKAEMSEALFNRALCYQQLLLKDPALEDFKRAAAVEHDKGWLEEITRRHKGLSRHDSDQESGPDIIAQFEAAVTGGDIDKARRLIDQNSEGLRRHVTRDLCIQQLQAALDGDQASETRALSEMELIGRVLMETRGDSTVADIARYLRNLPKSDRQANLELFKGYVAALRINSTTDAKLAFERLEKQFRARRNFIFEAFSAYEVAQREFGLKRFRESVEKLRSTLSLIELRPWPLDRARMLTQLAYDYSRLGQDSLAIRCFDQAILLCNRSPELEAKILQYISAPYFRIGDLDTALARLRDSTALFLKREQQTRWAADLAYNYFQIADIYSLRSSPRLASLYGSEALRYAELTNNNAYAAESSSFNAVERARLNQFDGAEADLKRADAYVDKIETGTTRDFTQARVLTNAGEVALLRGELDRALRCYDQAEGLTSLGQGHDLEMIEICVDRSRVYAALQQNERAHSDLMGAVDQIEGYREKIETSDQRSQFLATSNTVFDQLISVDVSVMDQPSEALYMSERSRARALLEEISRTQKDASERSAVNHAANSANGLGSPVHANPLSLGEIQNELPDDLAVLEYSVTSKGTYLFLITKTELVVRQSAATTQTLDRLVRDYIADLRQIASLDELDGKARSLYDYLIRPVEYAIRGRVNLCIVPDKALHFLPFAGLPDGLGNYLIATHTLTYAPSASVLVQCIKKDKLKPAEKVERVLAVGDPKFDRDYFPNLNPLEAAEQEAMQSAKFYAPGSLVLTGPSASERNVRAAIKECDVAHLALHALIEESSPGLAALVLASTNPPTADARSDSQSPAEHPARNSNSKLVSPTSALTRALPREATKDPNDGLFYLSELYDMKVLPRTKLVVLSACQSGLGQYYRGEGIVSLVRPLLAAGVPAVVASLWPVESKATSDLMIQFHKHRKQFGLRTADALRRAQIESAKSYQHPYYWAPFIVVGSSSASR